MKKNKPKLPKDRTWDSSC